MGDVQVDIFQMSVLEFESRPPEDRFYHLEHFIEGHYVKYNSNSGFVDDGLRHTPQVQPHALQAAAGWLPVPICLLRQLQPIFYEIRRG